MKKKNDFSAKPYNRCLYCEYRGAKCDGPRTSAMPLERWCEFMRDMKKMQDLTNADIAELSGVSVKTVERLIAGNDDQDVMRETARAIENAIIGSSNQYPCYLAFLEGIPDSSKDLAAAAREMDELRRSIDSIHASYQAELRTVREEAQKKIDFLKGECARKDAAIEKKDALIEKLVAR